MKCNLDALDLRAAFAPMPDDLHEALIQAASSVREETKMKKFTIRAVLIAALILTVTMSMALAASELLGWTDFFAQYDDIDMPPAAQDVLSQTGPLSFQAGPLTFTLQQALCDGRIALASIAAHTTDGSDALYSGFGQWNDPIAAGTDSEAKRLGMDGALTWREAAQQCQLPLYAVDVLLEVSPEVSGGETMGDYLWNGQGHIIHFSMPTLNEGAVKDSLPVSLYLHVTQIDPATGESVQEWTSQETATLPVTGRLAEKSYFPAREAAISGFKLERVWAEQYITGAYLSCTFTALEGADSKAGPSALYEALQLTDGNGQPFQAGLNMTGEVLTDSWPTVIIKHMITVSELPPALMLVTPEGSVTLR